MSMVNFFYKNSQWFLTNNCFPETAPSQKSQRRYHNQRQTIGRIDVASSLDMKDFLTSVNNVLPILRSDLAAKLLKRSVNVVTTLQRPNFTSASQRLFNVASTLSQLIFWYSLEFF